MSPPASSQSAGLLTRVVGGLRYAVTGTAPAWFWPLAPLKPEAPAGVAGRQSSRWRSIRKNH